ncbi:hypothetical protein GF325_08170 [Candidatus Bathyarchaeota archaeon]|nr:hypothetical protein [Candidatus Bathyarchaeota archaeon]
MSETKNHEIEEAEKPAIDLDPKTMFRIEKKRINWIDQARGFVMFFLVLTSILPSAWREGNWFANFFLEHPPDSTNAKWMNLYDVGVPAFFFILGLLMAVSFHKRCQKKGTKPALLNALLRWGLIFAVGILFILIPAIISGDPIFGEVKEIAPGVEWYVVRWDVVISIGFVGLACIPFLFLPTNIRLIVSYAMMVFYQVMIMIPETLWRQYAIKSVHGGILGSIFILIPITLISSVIGEFYILDKEKDEQTKNKYMLYLGVANLAIGALLWLIPGGYPNKRQSTMSWAVISLGVCIMASMVFILFDYDENEFDDLNVINKGRIILFKAYGMNPLLVYAIVEITTVVIDEVVGGLDFTQELLMGIILITAVTIIMLLLYRANKAISTTKVALGVIITVVILGAVLVPFL